MFDQRSSSLPASLLVGFIIGGLPAQQEGPGAKEATMQNGPVGRLLREGDALYSERTRDGMARKAIEAYQKALAIDEGCADAYWRIAKAHYWLASHEKDDDAKAKLFKEGIEYAKIGVSVDADNLAAHFWLSVMYGSYGQAIGIWQSLHMVEPMKKELEWILAKDERFEEAGAHRVLGRLYAKLPRLKGGDVRLAKKHFLRAVELAPTNTLNYLFLAELYLDQRDKAEAKKALETLLAQPDDPNYLPESKEQKEYARKKLAELEARRP